MNLGVVTRAYNEAVATALPGSSSIIDTQGRVIAIMLGDETIFKMDKDGRVSSCVPWTVVEKEEAKAQAYNVLRDIVTTISV